MPGSTQSLQEWDQGLCQMLSSLLHCPLVCLLGFGSAMFRFLLSPDSVCDLVNLQWILPSFRNSSTFGPVLPCHLNHLWFQPVFLVSTDFLTPNSVWFLTFVFSIPSSQLQLALETWHQGLHCSGANKLGPPGTSSDCKKSGSHLGRIHIIEHNDGCAVIIQDQSPKVFHCVWQRMLGDYKSWRLLIALQTQTRMLQIDSGKWEEKKLSYFMQKETCGTKHWTCLTVVEFCHHCQHQHRLNINFSAE